MKTLSLGLMGAAAGTVGALIFRLHPIAHSMVSILLRRGLVREEGRADGIRLERLRERGM